MFNYFLNIKIILIFIILIFIYYKFDNKNNNLSYFQKCSLPKIQYIPNDSTVVVGHAYGSSLYANKEDYISKKVEKFLYENKYNIKSLILTGDVFWQPTKFKWNKLFLDFNNYFNIHIAPGNHEIDNSKKIEMFKNTNFKFKDFYKIKPLENKVYYIENSILNNWHLNPFMIREMNDLPKNFYVIFRHNIAVKELVGFANSKALLSRTLPSIKNFHQKVEKINNLTIISGDGGAFKDSPRLICYYYKNVRFIINGIGDVNEDKIIVLYKEKLFEYNLN